jgi:hypothetical protein
LLRIGRRGLYTHARWAVALALVVIAGCAGTIDSRPLTAAPTPSASPTATATPSPTPPGALTASPTSVALNGTGSANAVSLTVAEPGYSGSFGESDTCAAIATIASANANGPSTTFTVTGVAAGSCSASFTDSFGQHAAAQIGVTASGFGVVDRNRGTGR